MRTNTLRCTLGKSLHKVQIYLKQPLNIIVLVLLKKINPLLSSTNALSFTAEPGLISFKGIAHPAVTGKEEVKGKGGKTQEQEMRNGRTCFDDFQMMI